MSRPCATFVRRRTDGTFGARAPISRPVDRDHALLEALRQGEPTAAERLVTTYGGQAYRLAIRITSNRADAEEVVQDALWAVVRKIGTFRGESAFASWLYRIVANGAWQKIRQRRTDISLDEFTAVIDDDRRSEADLSTRLEDPALQWDLRKALTAAIDALPLNYRAVIVLRDVEGLSNRAVADALGLSIANVKSRTYRARRSLRNGLGRFKADEAA
jgi:RNA polymerase sigma-70 factor, ECF subfamily